MRRGLHAAMLGLCSMILGSIATATFGQGAISVPGAAALGVPNSNKVVVDGERRLHLVDTEGGVVEYRTSDNGNAWSAPVPLSTGLGSCHDPAIALDNAATIFAPWIIGGWAAATFICGVSPANATMYYTYKPKGGTWSTPVALWAFPIESVAIVMRGTKVHLAWSDGSSVYYASFPVTLPPAVLDFTNSETIAALILCGGITLRTGVSIAVAPGVEVMVSYMELIDKRDALACGSSNVTSGVIVQRRLGGGNWMVVYGDTVSHSYASGVVVPTERSNSSLAASDSGEFFVGYSDDYCVSWNPTDGCTSLTVRTRVARLTPTAGNPGFYNTTSTQLEGTLSTVHVASRNHPGVNARVSWARKTSGCLGWSCGEVQRRDIDWHGTQSPTLSAPVVLDASGSDPQSLFFSRGPGGCGEPACDLGTLWVDPDFGASPAVVGYHECLVAREPIVYYTFDDPLDPGHDDSGHLHEGTVYQPNNVVPGWLGSAIYFDGTNAIREFDTPPTPDLDLTGAMTGIAWIRPKGRHTSDDVPPDCIQGTIFDKGGNYWLQVQQDNSGLLLQNEPSGNLYFFTQQPVPLNAWSRVAFSRGANPTLMSTFFFYQDGASVPFTGTGALGMPAANGELFSMGNFSGSPDLCEFHGLIDEVRIYDIACDPVTMAKDFRVDTTRRPIFIEVNPSEVDIEGGTSFIEDAGTITYDVVMGDLGTLRSTGDFSVATTACLASHSPAGPIPFTTDPALGAGFWFLARPVGDDGPYTYNSPDPGLARSRDYQIEASPAACP